MGEGKLFSQCEYKPSQKYRSSQREPRTLTIDHVLDSPSFSYPLKDALRLFLKRDAVDAYYDAKLLTMLLKQEMDRALGSVNNPDETVVMK